MLFQDIIFWCLASLAVAAALGVVLMQNIFRSALLLIVVFLTLAAQFVFLAAEFVGVVQLLIYAGAISILIIFAIMLTRDVQRGNLPNRMQVPAVLISSLLLVAFVFVFIDTDWRLIQDFPHREEILDQAFVNTTPRLAVLLMGKYSLAFLSSGLLLLGSIIGALTLVRERS